MAEGDVKRNGEAEEQGKAEVGKTEQPQPQPQPLQTQSSLNAEISGDCSSTMSSSSSSSGSSTARESRHHVLSIAPMIQWTDRHYRHIMRSLTKKTQLFTEMVMDDAIYFNRQNLEPFIGFDKKLEPPIALQIGGCTPELCGEAARCGEEYGYDEINLNAG